MINTSSLGRLAVLSSSSFNKAQAGKGREKIIVANDIARLALAGNADHDQ
jgi:hypothetical protein